MTNNTEGQKHYLLWIFLAVGFTTITIHQSSLRGKLALPPTFDDVMYFEVALDSLETLYSNGLGSLLLSWAKHPLHSPLSTIAALIGFLLFGINKWAPPLINGVFVFFLLAFVEKLAKESPIPVKILIALVALSWPVTAYLVIDCRPDIAWGLITACFMILCLQESWVNANRSKHLFVGCLIGFALLAKPTIFPITLVTALGSLFLTSLTDVFVLGLWHQKRKVLIANLRCLGIATLITLPHYTFAFQSIYRYIYDVVFSNNSSTWDIYSTGKLPIFDQLLFYLTGVGGSQMIGKWIYVWIFLLGIASIIALAKKEWKSSGRALVLTGGLIISYVLITVPKLKTPFFGTTFYFLVLFLSIKLIVYITHSLQSSLSTRNRILGNLVYLFISLLVIIGYNSFHPGFGLSAAEIKYRNGVIEQLYSDIRFDNFFKKKHYKDEHIKVAFSISSAFLNPHTLNYYLKKNDFRNAAAFNSISYDALGEKITTSQYSKVFDFSHYIVAFSPDNQDFYRWLPGGEMQDQVISLLRQRDDLALIKTYQNPYGGGQVLLYAKQNLLEDFPNSKGLDPLEGPYPQLDLPRIRWGLGPMSQFEVDIPFSGKAKLMIHGKPALENQILTVKLDNKVIAEHRFNDNLQFELIEIPLSATSGSHQIVFTYKNWLSSSQDPRLLAIMFRQLRVVSTESIPPQEK